QRRRRRCCPRRCRATAAGGGAAGCPATRCRRIRSRRAAGGDPEPAAGGSDLEPRGLGVWPAAPGRARPRLPREAGAFGCFARCARLLTGFPRRLLLLLWPAGVALGVGAEWALYGWADPRHWVPDLLVGWGLIGCGLAARSLRPRSRSGALMTAAGFAWFAPNFGSTSVGAISWLSAHYLYLHSGTIVQLVIIYPRGRSSRRIERAGVLGG